MTGIAPDNPPAARPKPIYSLLTMVVVIACIALPVLFWRGTWFGRRLSDEQLAAYLASTDKPRKLQHALTEITERIDKKDGATEPFYPAVAALAKNESWQVRNTAAWVMGWDHQGQEFHEALLSLLRDPVLVVRHNAALALTNFHDDSGKSVILSMLKPTSANSPVSGVIRELLPADAPVRAGLVIGRVEPDNAAVVDLKAPISGRIVRRFPENGDDVERGEPIYVIRPGETQLTQALKGLALIGDSSDLPAIAELLSAPWTTPAVEEQARLVQERIGR